MLEKLRPIWKDIGKLPVTLALWANIEIIRPVEFLDVKWRLTEITYQVGELFWTNIVRLAATETVSRNEAAFTTSHKQRRMLAAL